MFGNTVKSNSSVLEKRPIYEEKFITLNLLSKWYAAGIITIN